MSDSPNLLTDEPEIPGEEAPEIVDPPVEDLPPDWDGSEVFFATYDLVTGMISETGSSNEQDAPSQAGEGLGVIFPVEADVTEQTHYVVDGSVVPKIPLDPIIPTAAPFIVDMTNSEAVLVQNENSFEVVTEDPADPVTITQTGWYTVIRDAEFPYLDALEEIFVA